MSNRYEPTHRWVGIRPWQRHSLVLAMSGLVYMMIGYSLTFAEHTAARRESLQVAVEWMPLEYWGVVWFVAGGIAIVSSRWPIFSVTWGYTVLTGLAAAWAAFFAVSILFGDSPVTNVTGTLAWGLVAFMWWAISGLVNPDGSPPS
jgi:hypothetical protein